MKKLVLVFGFLLVSSLVFGDLFISEVADPGDAYSARFVELYNTGTAIDFDTDTWYLCRQSNGGSTWGDILLTGTIGANAYFCIAYNTASFETNYGFTPDQTSGNINGNGDDGYFLYSGSGHSTGTLVDAYGEIDVDGTGDPWEYLDAIAYRKNEISSPNTTWTASEWIIIDPGDTTDATPGSQNPDTPTTATITRAYTISSTRMDVIYDLSITSVDPADYTLTGTATITFTTAAIDGTDDRIVHLYSGSPAMSADLTMDNIDDTSTNLDFYAGIMPISNSNTNNPTRATMLNDYDATFTGIISANDAYNNVWISDASGAYNGVMIYDSSFDGLVSVGDDITLVARRDVYSGLTELVDPVLLAIDSQGNSPYGPDTIIGEYIEESQGVDTNPGESWEGQLVTIEDVYVESSGSYYYRCTDDGGLNYFYVGDNVDYHLNNVVMTVGVTYPSVTGVVDWYSYGPYYRINPRSQDDIVDPPTAVTLSEFTAQYASGELSIFWTTQSEVNNSGWNIYRGESEISHQNDETTQINPNIIPGSDTTSEPTEYVFVDEYEVTEGATYWYWIESRNNSGETETFGPISLTIPVEGEDPDDPNADRYGLFQNYPNPVSNNTTISFSLTEEKVCKLSIYNTKGQTIKDIYQGSSAGNSFVWDRTDNFGNAVSSGIYFYKLEAGADVYTKKLVVTE